MKVLHVISGEGGGAAIAAKRLSAALNSIEIDSKIAVLQKSTDDECVSQIFGNSKGRIIAEKILRRINIEIAMRAGLIKDSLFSYELFGCDITKSKLFKEADIIHLHQVNYGIISLSSLKKIVTSGKKIVWTQHDMWAFTGGCFYDGECGKYVTECVECPLFSKRQKQNLSEKQFMKKAAIFRNARITFVGCSKWITECAAKSAIISGNRYINIPNCLNIEVFKPFDRGYLHEKFSIDNRKHIVLFGSMSSTSDKRKGFIYLRDALKKLDNKKYALVIFGPEKSGEICPEFVQCYTGKISDEGEMARIYSGADVFVAPSVQENLANTVIESLSCGTPVVAFNIGGMPDMIVTNYNGYLAKAFDVNDLASGIERTVLSNELRLNARKFVVAHYSFDNISRQYELVYKG